MKNMNPKRFGFGLYVLTISDWNEHPTKMLDDGGPNTNKNQRGK